MNEEIIKSGVNPYGKVFVGQGVEIELTTFNKANEDGLNDALIKITGADAHSAGIDGKVIYHTASYAGTGYDFKYLRDNEFYNRMATRNAWGMWDFFEVYLNGKTVKVYIDDKKSKEVNTTRLFEDFKNSR